MSDPDHTGSSDGSKGYTVLARKYRPNDFDALIGQEALVRILTNAFELDRIPHALVLTGVRGVGKTTTARIIAKGLNCTNAPGPTIKPCGICDNCRAIADSSHVDVLEMDAASRTGIDDIREIIDSVRYRASQGRYKVYIVDEAHMLSKNAFNGLLKTLEEPPPHVKFILATTDIHKVPVTVLSRCMRFDLRRVTPETMVAHLGRICEAEGVAVEPDALALVARASEGSVRDALSILDQAIAHGAEGGEQTGDRGVSAASVRGMLGLAERERIFTLFEQILTGKPGEALQTLQSLYADSADPESVLREVAETCHLVSMVKIDAARAEDPGLPPADRERAKALAAALPMRPLSRAWQMLLKALEETARAPSPIAAAEMAVIRMTHVAELPSPEQLVRALTGRPDGAGASSGAVAAPSTATAPPPVASGPDPNGGAPRARAVGEPAAFAPGPRLVASAPPEIQTAPPQRAQRPDRRLPGTFDEIAELIRSKRDMKLLIEVELYMRPGPVRPGSLDVTLVEGAPPHLTGDLREKLQQWTGQRWGLSITDGHETETLMERRARLEAGQRREALAHPLVLAALETFPGAELKAVKPLRPEGAAAPLPQAPDDLDDDDMLDYGESGPEDSYDFDLEPDPEPR